MPPLPICKLDQLPDGKACYIWADYIELLCLTNPDGEVSIEYLVDRMMEREGLGELGGPSEEGEGRAEPFESMIGDAYDKSHGARYDRHRSEATDWFRGLAYRQAAFGASYPFTIERRGTLLRRSYDNTWPPEISIISKMPGTFKLTNNQKEDLNKQLYIYLLLASNLRYVNKAYYSIITSLFEVLCVQALKSYLPREAKVYLFGKNPLNNSGRYTGKLSNKVSILANDIFEMTMPLRDPFPDNDTGDYGLDVVGWIPFCDRSPSFIIILGQCACTEEWVNKSLVIMRWTKVITHLAQLTSAVFTPICFRKTSGCWHDDKDIHETILFDRVRLISLLKRQSSQLFRNLPLPLIACAARQREPIV
jgi:hypothetical protein